MDRTNCFATDKVAGHWQYQSFINLKPWTPKGDLQIAVGKDGKIEGELKFLFGLVTLEITGSIIPVERDPNQAAGFGVTGTEKSDTSAYQLLWGLRRFFLGKEGPAIYDVEGRFEKGNPNKMVGSVTARKNDAGIPPRPNGTTGNFVMIRTSGPC